MTGRATARRVLGVAVVTVLMATALGALPADGPAGAAVGRGDASRPVGVRTERFVDRSRRTPADPIAGITPAKARTLETVMYYPARGRSAADGSPREDAEPARGRFPLVLFNPGAPGTPDDYEVLLADWAAHGYVVAAIEFPVSSVAGPDDVAWKDLPAQSADATFVLDRVLGLDPEDAGIPEIDDERIAVVGHSFGGATALSLVSKCCRDDRIDAVAVLAGVVDTVRGPQLRKTRGPLLFVHARDDRSVPYTPAARLCEAAGTPKRLLTVETIRGNRAHVVPYLGDDEYAAVVRPAIVDFLDGYVRGNRAARVRLDGAGRGTTVGTVTRCLPGTTATTTPAA